MAKEFAPARRTRRPAKQDAAPLRDQRRQAIGAAGRGLQRIGTWSAPPLVRKIVWVVSLILVAVSIGVLVWGLYSALTYTLTHSGPPCSNPPQRSSTPPQWTVVLVCLGAYLVGHLTARLQFVDPSTTARHQRDPGRSIRKFGRGEYARRNEALFIQLLLLIFLVEICALLVIEAATLSNNVWPITYYVRCAYDAAGTESMWTAAAILFLVGRWFWLPARRGHIAAHSE
jgi:hypothetical protein